MQLDLLDNFYEQYLQQEKLALGVVVLRSYAIPEVNNISTALHEVESSAPFRHMITPGGFTMSVAMTNCGSVGWVTDNKKYRYAPCDPISGNPWPKMPACFLQLAVNAAAEAGYNNYLPDSCLINRYKPGTKLSLHQDKDEKDLNAPIVSVSLGLPAVFLFGGLKRSDKLHRILLRHGDVVVWGGPARLSYHGIVPLKQGNHFLFGRYRLNLTFRKVI